MRPEEQLMKRPDLAPARTVIQEDPEKAGGPIDFSECRSVEDVLQELKRMSIRKETLPNSDGKVKFTAANLAKSIEAAVHLALLASGDPQTGGRLQLPPDRLDEIFAEGGVTSTAGLREAMVRVMGRTSKTGEEFHRLVREIRQEGEFNPVNKLPFEQFIAQYPRESVPAEVRPGMDDTQKQVVGRWQIIDRGRATETANKRRQALEAWVDKRKGVVFEPDWITTPTTADQGFQQYGRAQEANRIKREAKEKEANQRNFSRIEGMGNRNSIAADIALILGAANSAVQYGGMNYLKGRNGVLEPKITRTYALPIEGAPGHTMTVTLFSEAKNTEDRFIPIKEVPEHFQGIMLEAVDQTPGYTGDKAATEQQKSIVELARIQMKKAEDQVRAKYGINLGIENKLAAMVS